MADRLELVITRSGKCQHYALPGADTTLCGHRVHERRVGGAWRPERPDVDRWRTCFRCENRVVEGEKP